MPSSFASSFSPIVEAIAALKPRKVIDIGPGWGKYGLACREYVPDLERLAAVEVPPGRLAVQDAIYDEVIEADVRTLPPHRWEPYDLALIIDVIEHMTIDEGLKLLTDISNTGCRVVLATPQVWMEQHDDHNPFETHVSLWSWEELHPLGIIDDRSTPDSIVYALGCQWT